MTAKEALKQASSFKDDYGLETTYNKDKTEVKSLSDNKAYTPITNTNSKEVSPIPKIEPKIEEIPKSTSDLVQVNQQIVAVQSN